MIKMSFNWQRDSEKEAEMDWLVKITAPLWSANCPKIGHYYTIHPQYVIGQNDKYYSNIGCCVTNSLAVWHSINTQSTEIFYFVLMIHDINACGWLTCSIYAAGYAGCCLLATQGYEQRALLATKTNMSRTRDYFMLVISFRALMATYKSILSYCISQEGTKLI